MSATWVTFVFEAANFALLAAVLGWLFFRPVRDAIERRRSELERDRQAAAEARAGAEQERLDARSRRAELEGSLAALRERVQREAQAERDRLLDAARAQAKREHEALQSDLVALRRAQARSLAGDAARAAREIVVRLLETIEGPDLERALLAAACRALQSLQGGVNLAPLVVESVRTLDDDSLAALAAASGADASETTRRMVPELVAGLRVLTRRGVIDVSAAGLAGQAERLLLAALEREGARDA